MVDESDRSSRAPSPRRTLLESAPLAHLFVVAFEKRLTGSADFETQTGESAQIVFEGGYPVAARTSAAIAYLGDVLVGLGHVAKSRVLRSVTEIAVFRRLQGELLLEEGAITEEQLAAGLREQLRRKLLHVATFAPAATTFAFHDAVDILDGWGGRDRHPIDPRPLVLPVLQASPPWRHVEGGLARVAGAKVHLSSRATLDAFALTPAQDLAARALAEPTSASEWLSVTSLPLRDAQLLFYALLIAKQVSVFDGRSQSIPPPPPPRESISPPPPSFHVSPAPATVAPPPVTASTASGKRPSLLPRRTIAEAEKHVAAQRFEEALGVLRDVLAYEPRNADALSLVAWTETMKPENQSAASLSRAINVLTRVSSASPNATRPIFLRGLLYKRLGDPHLAAKDFQRVLALAPSHADAASELRVYRMRVQKGSLRPPNR